MGMERLGIRDGLRKRWISDLEALGSQLAGKPGMVCCFCKPGGTASACAPAEPPSTDTCSQCPEMPESAGLP